MAISSSCNSATARCCSVHARRLVLACRRGWPSGCGSARTAPDARRVARHTHLMATAARAGFTYGHAFWRDAGHTGNAW
jgi:hypothetical protein